MVALLGGKNPPVLLGHRWRNLRHVLNHEHFCRGTVLGYGRGWSGSQGLEVSKLLARLSNFDAKFILLFPTRAVSSGLWNPWLSDHPRPYPSTRVHTCIKKSGPVTHALSLRFSSNTVLSWIRGSCLRTYFCGDGIEHQQNKTTRYLERKLRRPETILSYSR